MLTFNWGQYSDFYGDSLLTRYNINTGLINKFGTKGIGPNEILPPTTITVKDDKLYAFSKSNFKFGYFKQRDFKTQKLKRGAKTAAFF